MGIRRELRIARGFWRECGGVLPYAATTSGPDADAVAWATLAAADAGGTAVPAGTQTIIDTAIKALKSAGIWAKIDRLNFFAGSVQAHAKRPQKALGGNATETEVSTPTWSAADGYTFNGTSYLRTGWIPSSRLASSLSSHLACIATYGASNAANRTYLGASASAGSLRYVTRWTTANALQTTLGGGALSVSFAGEAPDGTFVGSYRSATDGRLVRNRNTVATLGSVTDARPTTEVAIGGWWAGASISEGVPCAISSYCMGTGLSDAEMDVLGQVLDYVHQALGRERRIAAWGDSMTATGSSDWLAQHRAALSVPYITTDNRGVGGETSSQVYTRFQANPRLWGYNTTIWVGRNGYLGGIAQVKADIAAMVAAIGHTRYRVCEVLPKDDGTEETGMANRTLLNQLNADLASIYGARYVPLLSAMQNDDGVPWVDGTPVGTTDASDVAVGLVPDSLRVDNTHLTQGAALINGRRSGNTRVKDQLVASIAGGW